MEWRNGVIIVMALLCFVVWLFFRKR